MTSPPKCPTTDGAPADEPKYMYLEVSATLILAYLLTELLFNIMLERNPEWVCVGCKKRHCFICVSSTTADCEHLLAIDTKRREKKAAERQAAIKAFARSALEAEAARKAEEERQAAALRAMEALRIAQRSTADAASSKKISETTKLCPKAGCGNRIERNGGCMHFTCNRCRTEFCWLCKAMWVGRQSQHLTTCRISGGIRTALSSLNQSQYATGWSSDTGYNHMLDRDVR